MTSEMPNIATPNTPSALKLITPAWVRGAIEAILSVFACQRDAVPPTINYENPDPECDLDYLPNQSREIPVNALPWPPNTYWTLRPASRWTVPRVPKPRCREVP